MGVTDRIVAAWNGLSGRAAVIPPWLPGVDNFWPYANLANGQQYPLGMTQTIRGKAEEGDGSFEYFASLYSSNAIVYACMLARSQLFSEARLQFQALRKGRPSELFSNPSLEVLDHPWPNGVTGDLLRRAIQDHDLAGNSYWTRRNGALYRMRPYWVDIVLGSPDDPQVQAGDIEAEVLGYIYYPGGRHSGRDPEPLLREQVAHFSAEPDPLASFRGMSWLTPVLREIGADMQLTSHKQSYLVNGATPNMVVSLDKDAKQADSPAAFKEWIELFKKTNPQGAADKYSTMYLAGGTKMEVVGGNLGSQGVDFKQVQGAGETRIAAAAGVPPVIVGLSEGLQAATYSNYGQARRRFADNTMRPLWRNFCGSFETLVPPPGGSRLWYDDRDIQALAEDKKDSAEVQQLEAQQIRTLTDAGYTPESVIDAVTADDFTRLVHTGLFSVQLQPPMPEGPPAPAPVPTNGKTTIPSEVRP